MSIRGGGSPELTHVKRLTAASSNGANQHPRDRPGPRKSQRPGLKAGPFT